MIARLRHILQLMTGIGYKDPEPVWPAKERELAKATNGLHDDVLKFRRALAELEQRLRR